MTHNYRYLAALTAAALLAPATPASARPALSTNWMSTTFTEAECLAHGDTAMHAAGLTRNFETLGEGVYGERGDYTASVRCLSGKGVVFFVVSGPKMDRASQLMAGLTDKF